MYAVGDVKGTVRQEPDGTRLKVESQKGSIAAEWTVDRDIDRVVKLIAELCDSPVSFASGEGESPWVEQPLSTHRSLASRLLAKKPPERMRLAGEDCLFLLRRNDPGTYALAMRTRSTDWQSVAEPLIVATASDNSRRELLEMYEEVTR